jgi:glycosyltransferase involved in cell wall biosynthesis
MKEILKKRWYKWIISLAVRFFEGRACRKSRIVIASSEKEKGLFIKLYRIPEEKIFVIPNGTCILDNLDKSGKQVLKEKLGLKNKTILFIGAYYNPNIEAAKEIVENIASKLPDYNFVFLGNVCDYFRNNSLPENIKLAGRVDDEALYSYLTASDIGINPVKIGSGINMKMLDYFSFGLPVVATKVGARGIKGIDGRDFIVTNIESFAMHIEDLILDEAFYERLSKNARKLAEEFYDWRKIGMKLERILQELINFGTIRMHSEHSFHPFCWRKSCY